MSINDTVDFYIIPLEFVVIRVRNWLICLEPTSRCIAVHEQLAEAVSNAIQMAEYRVTRDRSAQVHVRYRDISPWKTIWCSAGSTPRFP